MEKEIVPRDGIVSTSNENIVFIRINSEFYEIEAARAACYKFTDKCYILIKPYDSHEYIIIFEPRDNCTLDMVPLAKEYANELLDQQIRIDLNKRNSFLRNAIYNEAFKPVEGHLNVSK